MIQVVSLWLLVQLFQSVDNSCFSVCSYNTFGPSINQLTDPVQHGEGPTWDNRTGLLYFVDLNNGKLYSYNPDTGETNYIQLNGTVSPVVQVKNDPHQFVIGLNRSVALISWDGKSTNYKQRILTTVAKKYPDSRFNDGKADRLGRLWFGTIGKETGDYIPPGEAYLYLITKKDIKKPRELFTGVTNSNGLAWNKANNKFFYIDSPTLKIVQFDYKEKSANLSNIRVVYDVLKELGDVGVPDGMTIDKDDNLWVALFGGGSVLHIDSKRGKLIREIALPAKYITSVMWGGANLDILFVTSSNIKLTDAEKKTQRAAGSLFAIRDLNTSGRLVYEADILK